MTATTRTIRSRLLMTALAVILACVLTPPDLRGSEPLREALRAIEAKRIYEALRILSRHIPSDRERPLYYYIKGKALLEVKRHREAIDYLHRAYITAKDGRLREYALFERGLGYLKAGFYYEASANFMLFIRLFPESSLIRDAYIYYARSSLKTGRYVEALSYYRRIEEGPEVIFGKAEVFQRLGLYTAAAELYDRGLIRYKEYMQNNPDVLYYYADNLRHTGRLKEAKQIYYLLMDTEYRERAYLGVGLIEFSRDDRERAEAYFKRAALSPDRVVRRKALLYLGKTLVLKGEKEKAIEYLEGVRKYFPYTPESDEGLLLLATLFRERGEYLRAGRYLKEILFGRRPSEEAIDELDSLVRESMVKDPEAFGRIWDESGLWLFSPSREETLLEVAEFMTRTSGDFFRIYTYLRENGSREAKVQALSQLATYYARLGDLGKTEALYRELKALHPTGDGPVRVRAWLLALRGEKEDAFSEVLGITRPGEGDLELLWKVKEGAPPLRFIEEYRRMARLAGVPLRYSEMADFLTERGMRKEAARYYALALKVDPQDSRLMYKAAGEVPGLYRELSKDNGLYGAVAKTVLREEAVRKGLREM